jgi:protein-S-isoprenylcysteine O-methyltransferase Ste14
MSFARFVWLMGTTALVLPFLDLFWRATRATWVERALTARLVLLLLELAAIGTWVWFRGRWEILPEPGQLVASAGALLALTGGLLTAWAKVTLGQLFSVHLGVQPEHRLVRTGPYGIVRHPMYLGIIDYVFGSALVWNDAGLLVLAAAFLVFFTAQLRFEEEIFARHFGKEYREYQRSVPALLPHLRPGRARSGQR